jgi:hypothetical protein
MFSTAKFLTAAVAATPLALKGTPTSAIGTSVSIPTHAVGDIIVLFASRASSTTPTKPSAGGTVPAWVNINVTTGASAISQGSYYFVATATDHTTGTWTDSFGLVAAVLSGPAASPIGGNSRRVGSSAGNCLTNATTLTDSSGKSVLLYCYSHTTVTSFNAAPTGHTRQTTAVSTQGICMDTKDVTTSADAPTQTNTGSTIYASSTVEVLSAV